MWLKKEIRKYEGLALKDLILGGQDGLVNVLGIALGVGTATNDVKIILIAGLSGAIAEAFSMGAVAYTSSKTFEEYLKGSKGGKLKALNKVLSHPLFDAVVVFLAALIGSIIPLIPYFYFNLGDAVKSSLGISLFVLFIAGVITGKLSKTEHWIKSGLRILIIGAGAAVLGYIVGLWLGDIN
jgi:predicted membrane protein (TIGR00267 family)